MKISVIIPSLNAAGTLQQSLDSVWAQSHKDVELIVMDGGSTDGTPEILQRNQARIKHWQSEKDNGTTDALNNGFAKSTGELITFLCADDQLFNNAVLARVIQEFKDHPEADVLCCSLRMVDQTGLVKPYINPSNRQDMRRRGSLHMPGAFFKREVFRERALSYDVDVANDYELFAYITEKTNFHVRVSDLIALNFSLGGRTNNPKYDFRKINECFFIRRKYYGLVTAWTWYTWDMTVAILRSLHIRPLTWARKITRWTGRAHAN